MDQSVKVPWKAWYGDEQFALTFPGDWEVTVCVMDDAPELTEDEIAEAFERPIGTATIRELAKGKKSAAIVMDDMTRPTPGDVIPSGEGSQDTEQKSSLLWEPTGRWYGRT